MNGSERRASLGLSLIFMLRMLGLFLLLPIFMLHAVHYEGGQDTVLLGLAFGVYGLAQAGLQIPFGLASDRFGRKRIITLGLLLFIAGSLFAALSSSVWGLLLGRALQGLGAVSAAITALLADQTRDGVRTKAMAIVGIGIGLSFALSLVAAPLLAAKVGLSGVFYLMAVLGLMGLIVLVGLVPKEPERSLDGKTQSWKLAFHSVLRNPALMRLNAGVFVLHAVQTAMWLLVPALLVQTGLVGAAHWQVYLPALILSLLVVGGLLFRLERAGRSRFVFLCSIATILLAQVGLLVLQDAHALTQLQQTRWMGLSVMAGLLTVFFIGFNALEASQPSMVSKIAPIAFRGAAMGTYNTVQSLGLFMGGALGGWLVHQYGAIGVLVFNIALLLLWWPLAWWMPSPSKTQS